MAYQLKQLATNGNPFPLDADSLRRQIDDLLESRSQRYRRLWLYYRNPMLPRTLDQDDQGADRPYRQAQEWGLPSRVTGCHCGTDPLIARGIDGIARKEVVIENDIGWRIDTMVDFLFGKQITIASLATDPQRRRQIELILNRIIHLHGGLLFLQHLGTLGAVYGFVDVLVKFDNSRIEQSATANEPHPDARPASDRDRADASIGQRFLPPAAGSALDVPAGSNTVPPAQNIDDSVAPGISLSSDALLVRIAETIRLESVEPSRALPVLSDHDWRDLRAYVQVYRMSATSATTDSSTRNGQPAPLKSRWLSRVLAQITSTFDRSVSNGAEDPITITEILTANRWQRYEDEMLVSEGINSLERLPVVHVQNLAVPFEYSGTSDVEQLSPLQDELNTRLSDRAHRITMQSFKMYLGKGIEGFNELPVAPGRMWVTDNTDANVVEFGGDPSSPSEDQHITELREAMDKVSAVTPIAAGAIRGRVGNLTSAAALRVTLMALLARTERKRQTFGQALEEICELSLAWLDRAGLFHTSPDDRQVEVRWPPLLPDSQVDRLREAQMKQLLGVSRDVVLRELGYQSEALSGSSILVDRAAEKITEKTDHVSQSSQPSS